MTFKRMPRSGKFCVKLISIFLIPTFILSNIAYASPTTNSAKAQSQSITVTNPENIVVPREFGLVKTKFTGKDSRLIIHIQDAHCNYEAQSNIVKILETLYKNYNVGLVSVEGADGVIDTSWFKSFPDDEVRKEVADYFMKKGEITGPEFLSITTDYNIKLFGAETRAYYIDNLNAFTSSYPLKAETEKYLNSIKSALNKLKTYIYSEDLRLMDAKYQDYDSKKLQFNDYVKFLQVEADKAKINLRAYDNFFKLVSVLIYEKKIDFTVTDKERSALIDSLSKAISKEALTELVNKSLEFKAGKLSAADYYAYLKALAIDNGTDLAKDYPNLYNYIIYNSVYSKIENEQLFNDIKKLEGDIKEKLFTNDDQRTLEKLSRHIDILIGLVNIKLLNDDYEYFEKNKEEFSHEIFSDFIKKKTIQYGLAYEMDEPNDAVAKALPKLEDFYSIAIKRDKALVDNTLGQMNKDKTKVAVLVTGGFHSEGMSKLLEKQGVSYMVVCPSITKDLPTPYIQVLTNQRTPLEDILVTPVHASEGQEAKTEDVLAPPLRTFLRDMSDDDLRVYLSGLNKDYAASLAVEVSTLNDTWLTACVNGIEVGKIRVGGYLGRIHNGRIDEISSVATAAVDNLLDKWEKRCRSLRMSRADTAKIIKSVRTQLPEPVMDQMQKAYDRIKAQKGRASPSTGRSPGRMAVSASRASDNGIPVQFLEAYPQLRRVSKDIAPMVAPILSHSNLVGIPLEIKITENDNGMEGTEVNIGTNVRDARGYGNNINIIIGMVYQNGDRPQDRIFYIHHADSEKVYEGRTTKDSTKLALFTQKYLERLNSVSQWKNIQTHLIEAMFTVHEITNPAVKRPKNLPDIHSAVGDAAADVVAAGLVGGRDKIKVDVVATDTIRRRLSELGVKSNIRFHVATGEGEKDGVSNDAMLLRDEERGPVHGRRVDVVVDPVDGTQLTADAEYNAQSAIAVSEKDGFMPLPDLPMVTVVFSAPKQVPIIIDKKSPIEGQVADMLEAIAKANGIPVNELTVSIRTDRPNKEYYHTALRGAVTRTGASVITSPVADILSRIKVGITPNWVDIGLGGSSETELVASGLREYQNADGSGAQLVTTVASNSVGLERSLAKAFAFTPEELAVYDRMGIDASRTYTLKELVRKPARTFIAAVTPAEWLKIADAHAAVRKSPGKMAVAPSGQEQYSGWQFDSSESALLLFADISERYGSEFDDLHYNRYVTNLSESAKLAVTTALLKQGLIKKVTKGYYAGRGFSLTDKGRARAAELAEIRKAGISKWFNEMADYLVSLNVGISRGKYSVYYSKNEGAERYEISLRQDGVTIDFSYKWRAANVAAGRSEYVFHPSYTRYTGSRADGALYFETTKFPEVNFEGPALVDFGFNPDGSLCALVTPEYAQVSRSECSVPVVNKDVLQAVKNRVGTPGASYVKASKVTATPGRMAVSAKPAYFTAAYVAQERARLEREFREALAMPKDTKGIDRVWEDLREQALLYRGYFVTTGGKTELEWGKLPTQAYVSRERARLEREFREALAMPKDSEGIDRVWEDLREQLRLYGGCIIQDGDKTELEWRATAAATSAGRAATEPGSNMGALSDAQDAAFNDILRQSFDEGTYRIVKARDLGITDLGDFQFCVHYGLEARIDKYNKEHPGINLANDRVCAGRGGTRFEHKLRQAHISDYRFRFFAARGRSGTDALHIIANHEDAHIRIANGELTNTLGEDREEDFVDFNVPNAFTRTPIQEFGGKTIRQILADIDNARKADEDYRMEEALLTDDSYGTAARDEIIRLRKADDLNALRDFVKQTYVGSQGVQGVLHNIDLARSSVEGSTNPPLVAVISGTKVDAEYWGTRFLNTVKRLFRKDGGTKVYSLQEKIGDKEREGNFLGTLLAYRTIKNSMPDRWSYFRKNFVVLIGMLFGRGERMSPFTQIKGDRKPAIAASAANMDVAGRRDSVTAIEEAMHFFAPVADYIKERGFRGILNKWGDETQIPSVKLSGAKDEPSLMQPGNEHDMIKITSVIEITDANAKEKDWVVFDEKGNFVAQLSRNKKDILIEQLKALGIKPSANGKYYAGVSLGPIAVSYDMLDIMEEVFRKDVDTKGIYMDFDPYLMMLFAMRGDETKWAAAKESLRDKKDFQDLMKMIPDLWEKVNKVRSMFAERYGREPNLKVLNLGSDIYWADIGQHSAMREKYMAINDDGSKGIIARKIEGIENYKRDANGNIIVNSVISPDVKIKNSVIINSTVTGLGVINGSVIKDSTLRNVNIDHAFVVSSVRIDVILKADSGLYESVGTEAIKLDEKMRHGTLLTADGPRDMLIHEDTDLRKTSILSPEEYDALVSAGDPDLKYISVKTKPDGSREYSYKLGYDRPVLGNPVSFAAAYDMMLGVSVDELNARRDREVAKVLITMGTATSTLARHLVNMDQARELTDKFMEDIMPMVERHIKTPSISERRAAVNSVIARGIVPASKITPRVYRILFNVSEHLSQYESFRLKKYPGALPKAGQSPETGIVHLTINKMTRNEAYEYNIDNFPMGPFGTSGIRAVIEFLHSIANDSIAQGLASFWVEKDAAKPGDSVRLAGDLRPNTNNPYKSYGAMLKSIIVGLLKSHREVIYDGNVPTGAVTLAGILHHMQTIMNTASHNTYNPITGEWNGFKPTMGDREVLKEHERRINAHVREMIEREYRLGNDKSMYDKTGEYRKDLNPEQLELIAKAMELLGKAPDETREMYKLRYIGAFGNNALKGSVTGFWKHTAVGRELIPDIVRNVGGRVYGIGLRKDWDMPVDTEDVKPNVGNEARRLAKWLKEGLLKISKETSAADISNMDAASFISVLRTKLAADPELLDLFNQVTGYLPKAESSYKSASEVRQAISEMAKADAANVQGLDTTDGDSDRPGIFDENGEFIYGDKLSYLSCEYIRKNTDLKKPMHIVVTATANEKVIEKFRRSMGEKGLGAIVDKVQIGSPYVVKKMEEIVAADPNAIVVGFERNGGFLIGTDIEFNDGRKIGALPTRDSTFSLICAHIMATKEGKKISELVADRFKGDLSSFSWSGLVEQSTKETPFAEEWCSKYTAPMGQAIMRDFTPPLDVTPDKKITEVTFGKEVTYDTFDGVTKAGDATKRLIDGRPLSDIMQEIRTNLEGYFKKEDPALNKITRINYLDGVRIYFDNGEIIHMRPSGNQPQWRIYAEAATIERTKELIELRLKVYPAMIRDSVAKADEMRRTRRFVPKSIPEIMEKLGRKDLGKMPTWNMTFGYNGQHREEESIIFARDYMTLNSTREYDFKDPAKKKVIERTITYYPNDQKEKREVHIVEKEDGVITVDVSVTGENAFVDIGKTIDRNVPIMIWKAPFDKDASVGLVEIGQPFPIMSDEVMMELEWNGVSFLHLFNMMPSSIIASEPLLWENVFKFEKVSAASVSPADQAVLQVAAKRSPGRTAVASALVSIDFSPESRGVAGHRAEVYNNAKAEAESLLRGTPVNPVQLHYLAAVAGLSAERKQLKRGAPEIAALDAKIGLAIILAQQAAGKTVASRENIPLGGSIGTISISAAQIAAGYVALDELGDSGAAALRAASSAYEAWPAASTTAPLQSAATSGSSSTGSQDHEFITINAENLFNQLFNDFNEDALLGEFEADVNRYIDIYSRITNKEDVKEYLRRVADRALNVADPETSIGLQVMASNALHVITLIEQNVPGANLIRFTADANKMIPPFQNKLTGPQLSYIEAGSADRTVNPANIGIAKFEGDEGLWWRGWEGIKKLGDNVLKEAVYDQPKFDEQAPAIVMYTMLHVGGYHSTKFLHATLPGSLQYTSTGPGHLQLGPKNEPMLDVKVITRGTGIQYSSVYDAAGNLVCVKEQLLQPGVVVFVTPGTVDSIVSFGGLEFNDISLPISSALAEKMLKEITSRPVTFTGIANAANTIKNKVTVMPFVTMDINGIPTILLMPSGYNVDNLKVWADTFNPRQWTNLYSLYNTIRSQQSGAVYDGIFGAGLSGEAMKPTVMTVSTTPQNVARAAQAAKLAQAAQPVISRPTDTPVIKKYAWAGTGISSLLGREPEKIAEIWLNSTQKDGLSKVPGTDVTLAEMIAADPKRMLGPGMKAKPVFNKILGKDENQPQIVHIGFNDKIKGKEAQFVNLLINERNAMTRLRGELVRVLDTEGKFNEYRNSYEKWVAEEVANRWSAGTLPVLPEFMTDDGFDASIFSSIADTRREIVSYMNEVELKPGQVIISPVGYIHSIVGSHQTHPPTTHPEAKNEAWYIISDGKGGMLYFEPQQTSNTTYSPFDFPTPIVWNANLGVPVMRKDLTKGLDALLDPGETAPLNEPDALKLMAARALKFESTKPEDFIVNERSLDVTPEYGEPVRTTVESLISGSYPVMGNPPFNLERISLAGEGAAAPASIKDTPVKDSFHELTVVKGEVTVIIDGKEETLPAGSTIFVPAANKTPIEIKSNGEAEVLKTYPGKPVSQKAVMTASEIAAIENKETGHIRYLQATLKSKDIKTMLKALDVDDGVIINAFDTSVEDARGAVQIAQKLIDQSSNERVINIRATGSELRRKIQEAVDSNSGRIRTLIATTSNKNIEAFVKVELKDALKNIPNFVLNVEQMRDGKGRYMPVPGLQDLAMRIAIASVVYRDKVTGEYSREGARFICFALERVAVSPENRPFSIDDVMKYLRNGLFRILPRIVPVDLAAARDAYIAAQAALKSL